MRFLSKELSAEETPRLLLFRPFSARLFFPRRSFPLRPVLASLSLLALLVLPVSLRAQQPSNPPATTAEQGGGRQSTPEAQSPEKNKEESDENEAYRHSAVVKMLGAKLGMTVDQAATAFEVTNFVILAGVLIFFLARALPRTFRNRTSALQKRLVDARAATEEAGARLSGVEGRLCELDKQIAALREQSEKDLALEEQRVRASVEEERTKILAAAEQEIASATIQARRQIQQYAAELAVEQAAKKLVVSAETDRLLIQEFANRLTGRRGGEN